MRYQGSVLRYESSDGGNKNTVTISSANGTSFTITDPTVSYIDPGSCVPIDEHRVQCNRAGVTLVDVDVGDLDDRVELRVPTPTEVRAGTGRDVVIGGTAADTLLGEEGVDELSGGPGNDVLDGGLDEDLLAGDAGDDELRSRDGQADRLECAAGADAALADTRDAVAADCERSELVEVAPPPPRDTEDPTLRVRSRSRQRGSRVRLTATLSEPGTVRASATVRVGSGSTQLPDVTRPVRSAGGRVRLTLRLSATARERLRRRRRLVVRVSVLATDAAGNPSAEVRRTVRLRR